jgi:hypothetical protein
MSASRKKPLFQHRVRVQQPALVTVSVEPDEETPEDSPWLANPQEELTSEEFSSQHFPSSSQCSEITISEITSELLEVADKLYRIKHLMHNHVIYPDEHLTNQSMAALSRMSRNLDNVLTNLNSKIPK